MGINQIRKSNNEIRTIATEVVYDQKQCSCPKEEFLTKMISNLNHLLSETETLNNSPKLVNTLIDSIKENIETLNDYIITLAINDKEEEMVEVNSPEIVEETIETVEEEMVESHTHEWNVLCYHENDRVTYECTCGAYKTERREPEITIDDIVNVIVDDIELEVQRIINEAVINDNVDDVIGDYNKLNDKVKVLINGNDEIDNNDDIDWEI